MNTTNEKVKISSLSAGMQDIDIVVNVVSLQQKTLKNDRGESLYFYGIAGDETGTMSFTAWVFPAAIRASDVIEIKHCSVREYKGVNRLYIDSGSEVIMRPGEKIEVKRTYSRPNLRDLTTTQPYVSGEGRSSFVKEKELEREGQKSMMYYADLDDDTGRVRVSSFDRALNEGETIRIEGAKVSEYNGRLRLTIGSKTVVTPVKATFATGPRLCDIGELSSPVGGLSISGFVVSVGEKSGLVVRCSECNARLTDIPCPDHPGAPMLYDMFVYFTFDDGTGSVQCTGGKSAFLSFLGYSEDEFVPGTKSISRSTVFTRVQENLLGKSLLLDGDVSRNPRGLTFRVSSVRRMEEAFLNTLSQRMGADFQ